MNAPIQIIYVEDSADDVELVKQSLKTGGVDCDLHGVDSREDLIKLIDNINPHLVLSDFSLPNFDGKAALDIVRALRPEIPFIFVSGTLCEETAIELLRHGATDYVSKQRPARLPSAVQGALSDSRERSHLKTMERRLQHARRMDAIGTMAGGIAHDFNNLLAVVKVNAELLHCGNLSRENIADIASVLERTADRGAQLTKELLIFGRKTTVSPTLLKIKDRIVETVSLLKGVLPAKVSVTFAIDDDLPPILMDASHFDRMMTNLITNAADAMPNGGVITLRAKVSKGDGSGLGSGNVSSPFLCLQIADTGVGMSSATLEHALEPFYTTKPEGKGTGLGLSVVFGLMQSHHGSVRLESEEGKGTTVSLFFPLESSLSESPPRVPLA